MRGTPLKKLVRGDRFVEIPVPMWAEMLGFLSKCGWQPSVPVYFFLADGYAIGDADAASLAAAGEVVLDETLKGPIEALQVMRFDWAKFAEMIAFAAGGSFQISTSG